jgi:hypothetical protein
MSRGEQEAIFVSVSECIEAALTFSQHTDATNPAVRTPQEIGLREIKRTRQQTAQGQEKHNSNLKKLEATVSNPNYEFDLNALEDNFDLAQVVSPKTIIIVTGSHIICELLDRPAAEILRDEIDRQGNVSIGRRAIIIGDLIWLRDAGLQSHHVISVGGPSINQLTGQITSQGNTRNYSPGLYEATLDGKFIKVALWGTTAAQTRESVESYVNRPNGLMRLLDTCWK